MSCFFFFSSRRRHTRCSRDWSSDVCSSDLGQAGEHIELARRFLDRRMPVEFNGHTFLSPAPEERIVVGTLQRMYRHLYFRICDIPDTAKMRSEEHTSELQSRLHLVCRLLLEKKKKKQQARSTDPGRLGLLSTPEHLPLTQIVQLDGVVRRTARALGDTPIGHSAVLLAGRCEH